MATDRGRGKESLELDRLIDEILVDAYGDDEQLWAFRQAFEDHVAMPAEAFVVGEPVTVMRIDYDGNERRGVTAGCGGGGGSGAGNAFSCRLRGKEHVITLRPAGLWDVAPGEIIMVSPRKQWRYRGHPYLSGEIKAWRLDIAALGLIPLKLKQTGMWNPKDQYWGEPDEPTEEWAKPIRSRGPRPEYAMEQG